MLGECIGREGFGVVYRALQPGVECEVAIKIILPIHANNPEFIRRFDVEAQLVAKLEHPHIVPLHDYWREPNVAYLVMRLLRGGNLLGLLKSGPLQPELTLRILEQIGSALGAAHRAGIVHRDPNHPMCFWMTIIMSTSQTSASPHIASIPSLMHHNGKGSLARPNTFRLNKFVLRAWARRLTFTAWV